MLCQLKNFSQYLETLLEPKNFQDVSINGVQVFGNKNIRHLATAVTASVNSIRKAKSIKADCLLVHHGLLLKGKEMLVTGSYKEMLALLLESNISLIAYHLPLDAHHELGNNWAAAKRLGWNELEPFGTYQGVSIGVKGVCPPTSREKFQKQLERFYGRKAQCVFGGPKIIRTCGLISGGAHKWIQEACEQELDCFVTGTADEPTWHSAHQDKINFFALGHAATERIGIELLGDHLSEQFTIKHTHIHENNPF